jgi:hypothetical protein
MDDDINEKRSFSPFLVVDNGNDNERKIVESFDSLTGTSRGGPVKLFDSEGEGDDTDEGKVAGC